MTVDRYTKAVLTIIAACLLWLCVMASGRPVEAQAGTSGVKQIAEAARPVIVVGWGQMNQDGQVVRVFTTRTAEGTVTDPTAPVRLPYNADAPLPVSVGGAVRVASSAAQPVAVSVTQIEKAGGKWDPIATKEEPAPTRRTPGEVH